MPGVPNDGGSERAVILSTTGLLLAAVLPQYLIAALAVQIRTDFTFTDAQLGFAVGISFAISAIVSPLAGRTVTWIGLRRGVVLAAALITGGSAAIATVTHSAAAIVVCMAVVGLGAGIGSPSFSMLLARQVRPGRHGAAFGTYTSAPQVAAFAAGLALPAVAQPLDWRLAFVLPVAAGAVSVTVLVRRGMSGALTQAPGERSRARRRLPRAIYAVAFSAVLASAAGIGMRSFLVVFAISVGFGDSAAGILLSVTGLVAMGSRFGFGVLGDRRPGRPLNRAAALMAVSAAGFGLMAVGGHLAIVVGAVLAGGLGWGWQSPLSHAVVSNNPDTTAGAIGVQMAGFFAGAVVGPLLLGLFAQHGSYTAAWWACTALALVATLVALRAERSYQRIV
jgi:MFS family permease